MPLDPTATARELAHSLMTDGTCRTANRLVMEYTPAPSINAPGLCEQAIADRIAAALQKHGDEQYARGVKCKVGHADTPGVQVVPDKDHILDADGVVRKVLGTLPLTADGCVVSVGAYVYEHDGDDTHPQWVEQKSVEFFNELECNGENIPNVVAKCYSTRALAEAAAESAKTKEPT